MENGKPISDELIKNEIISLFLKFGNELGVTDFIVQEKSRMTSIYLIHTHALELQIDWFDNSLFVYVVRLINKQIPSPGIIYSYNDGSWCRKIIQDLFNSDDNKQNKKRIKNTHTRTFIFELLDYHIDLMKKNSSMILDFLKTGNCSGSSTETPK